MSMGLGLGLSSLYFAFRPTANAAMKNDSMMTAALFGSLYWITGLSAILYPGSKAIDPEFGEGFPQFWAFTVFGLCSLLGSFLEIRQLQIRVKKTA